MCEFRNDARTLLSKTPAPRTQRSRPRGAFLCPRPPCIVERHFERQGSSGKAPAVFDRPLARWPPPGLAHATRNAEGSELWDGGSPITNPLGRKYSAKITKEGSGVFEKQTMGNPPSPPHAKVEKGAILSKEEQTNLTNGVYTYKCVNEALLDPVLTPFWELLTRMSPLWLHPNTMTLVGSTSLLPGFFLSAYYAWGMVEVSPMWL